MSAAPLLLERVRSWRPRLQLRAAFWIAVHILALGLQWYTVRGSPLLFHKANGSGWSTVCIGVKEP